MVTHRKRALLAALLILAGSVETVLGGLPASKRMGDARERYRALPARADLSLGPSQAPLSAPWRF